MLYIFDDKNMEFSLSSLSRFARIVPPHTIMNADPKCVDLDLNIVMLDYHGPEARESERKLKRKKRSKEPAEVGNGDMDTPSRTTVIHAYNHKTYKKSNQCIKY